MLLFVIIIIDSLAYVFSISAIECPSESVGRINTGSQEAGVPTSLRLAVVPLFLSFILLVGDFASRQEVW